MQRKGRCADLLSLDHQARKELRDNVRIRQGYLGFHDTDCDFRGSFNGSVVKPTYTKAAHLACLRDRLPKGKITLVGEQEAPMVFALCPMYFGT